MNPISTAEVEQAMLDSGYRKESLGGRPWYTRAGYGGVLELAAAHFAEKTCPELPSITRAEAEATIAAAKGNRLDDNPPPPDDFTPGIKAAMSLAAGEIRLNSRKWQMVSAMLDVAAFGRRFEYRREILRRQFPALGELPCDIAAAVAPVVHEVYEGAIKMGRAMSYACLCSPAQMIEYARLGNGSTVIQLDNLYECWIIPNGKAQVFAKELGDPNGTGNLPMWIRVRIQPLADVSVGWIR